MEKERNYFLLQSCLIVLLLSLLHDFDMTILTKETSSCINGVRTSSLYSINFIQLGAMLGAFIAIKPLINKQMSNILVVTTLLGIFLTFLSFFSSNLSFLALIAFVIAIVVARQQLEVELSETGLGIFYVMMGMLVNLYTKVNGSLLTSIVSIAAFIYVLKGIKLLVPTMDLVGKEAFEKLRIGALLGLVAAVLGIIPLVGAFSGIVGLAAYFFYLLAFYHLKGSKTIGIEGVQGANLLFLSTILNIFGAVFIFTTFLGGILSFSLIPHFFLFSSVFFSILLGTAVLVLTFIGWSKIYIGIKRYNKANTFEL